MSVIVLGSASSSTVSGSRNTGPASTAGPLRNGDASFLPWGPMSISCDNVRRWRFSRFRLRRFALFAFTPIKIRLPEQLDTQRGVPPGWNSKRSSRLQQSADLGHRLAPRGPAIAAGGCSSFIVAELGKLGLSLSTSPCSQACVVKFRAFACWSQLRERNYPCVNPPAHKMLPEN